MLAALAQANHIVHLCSGSSLVCRLRAPSITLGITSKNDQILTGTDIKDVYKGNEAMTPIRWKQRLENLQKAQLRLSKACAQKKYNELELAGLVQTFEFTFELTWKTLKDLLNFEGFDAASPRSVIRTALEAKHLNAAQCETLLEALIKRNLLTHTYDEAQVLQAQLLIKESFEPTITNVTEYLTKKSGNEEFN